VGRRERRKTAGLKEADKPYAVALVTSQAAQPTHVATSAENTTGAAEK
jgi:hypothetical protein